MNPMIGEMPNLLRGGKVVARNVTRARYTTQHARRGHKRFSMSRGELVEFNRCPARWLAGYEGEESKSTEWGSIIDGLVFATNGSFEEQFAITPENYYDPKSGDVKPWNWNANVCKEWREQQGDRKPIKFDLFASAKEAAGKLVADPSIKQVLRRAKKQVMVKSWYDDAVTGIRVPIRCLIDLVPHAASDYGKCLADLKTCRSGALDDWTRAVFEHGYDVQAALYLDAYTAATGEDRTDFLHILQENVAPYQVGRRLLSQEFIEFGRQRYARALERYCKCLASGEWPGYEDGANSVLNDWAIVNPEPWMVGKNV